MKFGTDGIRGDGDTVNPPLAWALGRALGQALRQMPDRPMVGVARDTRLSGPALEAALCAGLEAEGVRSRRLGIFPTPGLSAVLRAGLRRGEERPAGNWGGGVMITASHNPPGDNGLKILDFSGNKPERHVLDDLGAAIDRWLPQAPGSFPSLPPSDLLAGPRYLDSLRRVTGHPPESPANPHTFYGPSQPLRGLKIVVDCANGAGQVTAPGFLADLGAIVTPLHTGDGSRINLSCGSLHPEGLVTEVLKNHADFGIALDGDADRGILVLADGRILDGDDLLWLCAQSLPGGSTLVGTIMTNAGLEQGLTARGIHMERTPVGDAYIADALRARAPLSEQPPFWLTGMGGETSGHLLLSPWLPTADGLLSCILGILALQRGADLDWPRQPQIQKSRRFSGKIPSTAEIDARCAAVRTHWEQAGARIVVRPSGTEPLVRIMVEHPDEAKARRAAEELLACLPAI